MNDIRHTETYRGRTITVVEVPRQISQWSARPARIEVRLDEKGHTYQGGAFPIEHSRRAETATGERTWEFEPFSDAIVAASLKKAIKKGRQWVDADIADEEIRPVLRANVGYIPRHVDAHLDRVGAKPEDFKPGDVVWFYSRGNFRQGVVEKVGRTNVGVAYVTEDTGRANITRKNLKPAEIGLEIVR